MSPMMSQARLSTGETNYKWYILTLAALTHTLVIAIPTMAMPVLFQEISEELGLSLVQVGLIWGAGSLTGIFTGLLGGAMGDRFGAKRTLMVTCLLAGVSGALRGLAGDFITLAGTMFLFGFITPAIPMNVHKTCGLWFSGRRLGLANGVASGGMALGFMVGSMISATVMSPWLGSWRSVLLLYGGLALAMSLPWALTRAAPQEVEGSSPKPGPSSMRQTFHRVSRLRNIWLLGLAILGIGGCVEGTLGYLPLYLRAIGWPVAGADGALATFHAMNMLAAIPLALLSDRLGSRKRILIVAALAIATGVGLLTVAQGMAVWVAVIIAGLFRDGFMALFMTSIIEVEGVGAAYAGTAMGLAMVFNRLGSLVAPPLGNSLAGIAPSLPFAFWATLAVLGLFCFYFIQEAGPRNHLSQLTGQQVADSPLPSDGRGVGGEGLFNTKETLP
jgi:ACS family hexuronate transporter-like MFS transporter